MNITTVDGAFGEGGGQVLRTSLALAVITGRPIRLVRIRQGRKRPGLLRQHLTAVKAAAAISNAHVEGAELGSTEVVFRPGPAQPGDYHFAVGSAGSAGLVLQTVLMPLLVADAPSRVTVEGGTHNPTSPPFDFLEQVFLPALGEIGARVKAKLLRPGFYPAGGGAFQVDIEPWTERRPFSRLTRGPLTARRGRALISNLPTHIGEREIRVLRNRLGLGPNELSLEEMASPGPGNAVLVELSFVGGRELVAAFGERGVRAEEVANRAVHEVEQFLALGAPVGEHLADQLLLPLSLGAGGTYLAGPLSSHAATNAAVISALLAVNIELEPANSETATVRVTPGEFAASSGPSPLLSP